MVGKSLINSNSVILVSGGARGITAQCVIKLAQHSPCKFILLGRTILREPQPEWAQNYEDDADLKRQIMTHLTVEGQKPTPQAIDRLFRQIRSQEEIQTTLDAVHQAGAQVEYVGVDVTDAVSLELQLKEPIQRMGKISGIIHGAGTLADKRIEKKTARDFDIVFSPKVDGLQNLLKVVPASQLDFLVLFSSVAGFFGNAGQADYAMANEVLNKVAFQLKRENPACHVLSFNWGPWDSGMVTPELKRAFAERNMEVIPTDSGAELLVKEITASGTGNEQPVQIIVGSIPSRPATEISSELRQYKIHRKLSLDANPFLLDHQIGQHPVLPATCAASWAASLCEQLYPGYNFSLIEDFKVLKGIVFDENLAKEYILELKEVEKIPGGKVKFDALIRSQNNAGRTFYHYSLKVTLQSQAPVAPFHILPPELLTAEKNVIHGEKLYNNGTLFHGPSFQGVQRVLSLHEDRLVMECMLPAITEKQQGQFPVQNSNPFLYDSIVQSLLIWTQRYYQAPSLPSQLVRLENYKAIPFNETCLVEMQIVSTNETTIIADVWATDPKGEVYVKFIRLQGTISPLLNRFIGVRSNN